MSDEARKQRARENAKRYYQKNKEKVLKRQKEYVKKRYREDEEFRNKIKEKNRNYVINNPEKAREIKRKSQHKYINKKRLSGELPLTQKMLIDTLQQENQELKRQLEYLRSGEYLNQLRFERDMLQDIVINSEVSKEDKEFIDMTHRNAELLKENQELKQKYENAVADYETTMAEKNELERQQKEFVKYLENCINELKKESMNKLQNAINLGIVDITKEILSKYQEIIGQNNG